MDEAMDEAMHLTPFLRHTCLRLSGGMRGAAAPTASRSIAAPSPRSSPSSPVSRPQRVKPLLYHLSGQAPWQEGFPTLAASLPLGRVQGDRVDLLCPCQGGSGVHWGFVVALVPPGHPARPVRVPSVPLARATPPPLRSVAADPTTSAFPVKVAPLRCV